MGEPHIKIHIKIKEGKNPNIIENIMKKTCQIISRANPFLKRDGKDTVGKLNYQGLIKLFLIFSNFFL